MSDEVRPEEVYEALFDDEAFAQLPHILARAGGGRSAVIQWSHVDGQTQALAYSYYSPDYVAAYADGFVEHDMWLAAATRPENLNRTIRSSDHLSLSAFEHSMLYNDYSRAHGDDTFYTIGSAISSPSGTGLISVGRGRLQPGFELEDVARLDRVIRFARQVLRARGEIASAKREAALSHATLDSVGLCVVTVRGDGRVLHLNSAGERVLREGGALRILAGFLQTVHSRDSETFAAALAAATRASGGVGSTVALAGSHSGARLTVSITPLVSSGVTAALLTFRPVGSRLDLALQLRQVYGLTRLEAELAVSMYEGRSQREHAEARGVLESTVKSQLKSLTTKMGCRRQVEVVALIANLPPPPSQLTRT